MASKTPNEKCSTQLKKGKVQDTLSKLVHKLQLDLERDILRLFQDSFYCDIKLIVSSSSVLTHSCILRARACRFYNFIYAEFEVFEQDGISIFNICNASFTYLQSFVENIYTNIHSPKAEECIIKHLQETKIQSSKVGSTSGRSIRSVNTPETDLFFTPKSSPSELQKPFTPSKLKLKENNVASYYKIVSVDDIPVDEKLEGHSLNENNLLEKEIAEQDELLSSFKTIFSKKNKPNSLSSRNSSQSTKKAKPKFNKKFEANVLLLDDHNKGNNKLPLWKPNPLSGSLNRQDKHLGLKINKKNFKLPEKIVSEANLLDVTNSLCDSDMDLSTTGGDSGLENSSFCQQEISPKENTVSETSGIDLTEAAINEEIPNDETVSIKQSPESSVSSDVGTWEVQDELKPKSPLRVSDSESIGKINLNVGEVLRSGEMESNMRDCEIFLIMERQGYCESILNSCDSSETAPAFNEKKEVTHQYSQGENDENNPEELEGETDHRLNIDEEANYYNYDFRIQKNSDDAITSSENVNVANNLNKNHENTEINEFSTKGASNYNINSEFANAHETKTPPCTPKKAKTEENYSAFSECKPKSKDSTAVSNYFIDASSLLDEDEIISPPVSLLNFKPFASCEENEPKEEEKPVTISKKIVTNFFASDSNVDSAAYLKEQEKRQGEIIFKNSIPHFSKHEVEDAHILETERLRGGADHYTMDETEDDSEQVVPSTVIDNLEQDYEVPEKNAYKFNCGEESNLFNSTILSVPVSESPKEEDHFDGKKSVTTESQMIPSSRESMSEESIHSTCTKSPNFRRRNEAAPILSGGNDYVEEEKKVQKKINQSQGEAWIVTFDDNKKSRQRFTSSDTGSESESGRETKDEGRISSIHRNYHNEDKQNRRNEPSVEIYVKDQNIRREEEEDVKAQAKMYPMEKSSSFGYFLDFGKEPEKEKVCEKVVQPAEKKNMFSMFIGMDENSKPTFSRKPKPVLEKENTFDKRLEDTQTQPSSFSEEVKKPFYMFIESDSPSVKRKQIPIKFSQYEKPSKKTYLRTQSYTIEPNPKDEQKSDIKTDLECSSSDNSLPYDESGKKINQPFREKTHQLTHDPMYEPKITAWSETKVPKDCDVSSESWLKTKGIQVNYKEKNEKLKEKVNLKKDSTFIMDECKGKNPDKLFSKKDLEEVKPPKRDSGVILSERNEDVFVKLSDLDNSESFRLKQGTDKMSQSISENSNRKNTETEEIPLSKSAGSEIKTLNSNLYDNRVSLSLIRLFPNLSPHHLASISRKDISRSEADPHASETSEVSSSLQSSVEPTGLEISTSETDVSTHVETSSRLGEALLKMFLDEISPDVIVEVAGRRIKAHKCILRSRCQYFAAMLSGGWVESAGNVISLQGFSYNAVHFALRYIYSGDSRIPESLSIVELATLADMLCLDGLQEIISYNLKVKYCHSFHVPCSVCSVGVLDCLPITAAYGLDDLYRKCLRWITKYFVKLWPTKSFGSLPKELLEKCYQHYVVHMTVDNVLDTIVNIDKVRGSLPNVRWAESVSRLVNKLHDATVRFIAEHFSSVLTSDNFLALGKEAGWNVSRLEDSLIETIRYLPPEQACWSHARLHRILSVANGPDPPPEMDWNDNFLKLLQLIAELVENSLIKQAPRAAKSKAWKQLEPELRSRIQEAACLVLPDQEPSSTNRRSAHAKKEMQPSALSQTSKSRNFEIRQIKLAMSQQVNRNQNASRPLSLQIDQRPKKDSRFVPLRPSVSTSSVRKPEPIEGIRKTQSRSQIIGSANSEPKKTTNPRYSEVKSRYLEPKSPQKNVTTKPTADTSQRRTFKYISSSDSSRNCSPALRSSNSKTSIPQARKSTIAAQKFNQNSVLKSSSTSTLDSKRMKSETPSTKTLSRFTGDENMSSDSLCTESLLSDKEATSKRRLGKENLGERRRPGNPTTFVKSTSNSPVARRQSSNNWTPTATKITSRKPITENKPNGPKKLATGRIPTGNTVLSPKTTTSRNQRSSGKPDQNLVNGNPSRRRSDVDSENNKKNVKEVEPSAVSRSGTFLKDGPTIIKKPQVESEV